MRNALGLAVVLCALVGIMAPPAAWADSDWIVREYGEQPYHEYKLVKQCGGWTACQSTAEGFNGNLVTLEDGAEADWA